MLSISQYLSLRIAAEAAAHQSQNALDHLFLLLRLADANANEPILISLLVRLSILNIVTTSIWDGLNARCWNDQELAAIQKRLEEVDLSQAFSTSIRGERGGFIQTYEKAARDGGLLEILSSQSASEASSQGQPDSPTPIKAKLSEKIGQWVLGAYPRGLMFNDLAIFTRLEQQLIEDSEAKPFATSVSETIKAKVRKLRNSPDVFAHFSMALVFPTDAFDGVLRRIAQTEVGLRQTLIACGLERYRLAHGEYPESLTTLSPDFLTTLPDDVSNKMPFHYNRIASDQFMLWSVGSDGINDNGLPPQRRSDTTGDWVWKSASEAK